MSGAEPPSVPEPQAAAPARDRRIAWIVAAGTAARLVLALAVPLTNDEAYYVDWARHLAPGYLDHPPLVAWLVAPFLRALGPSALAVRLPAVALQAGTTLLAASLARALAGPRAAVAAAALLQAAPVFSLGAVLATPDAPLALAWTGVLWALERALRRDGRWFLAAGGFLGMAALSKLTAGLLGLAVLGALVATRDGRRALRSPWPWLGAALALALSALPVAAFFTIAAALTPGALPHWPAPGWLSALVLLAASGGRGIRAAVATGLGLVAAGVAVLALLALPVPLPESPLDELRGWRGAAAEARARAGGARLAATHWIVLGQLGWYAGEPVAYVGERPCAASYWPPDPADRGPLLVVTVDGLGPGPDRLAARLGPLEPAGSFTASEEGRPIRTFRFFRAGARAPRAP